MCLLIDYLWPQTPPSYARIDPSTTPPARESRVAQIFFQIFPFVATALSLTVFALTLHPLALLSTLGFGYWSLRSLCSDLSSFAVYMPQRQQTVTLYNPQPYVDVYVPPSVPPILFHTPQPMPRPVIFNIPPEPRPMPRPVIFNVPPQPQSFLPMVDFLPPQEAQRRAPIGTHSSSPTVVEVSRENPFEQSGIGRNQEPSPLVAVNPQELQRHASVGRRPEETTPTVGSGATTRAMVGRRGQS